MPARRTAEARSCVTGVVSRSGTPFIPVKIAYTTKLQQRRLRRYSIKRIPTIPAVRKGVAVLMDKRGNPARCPLNSPNALDLLTPLLVQQHWTCPGVCVPINNLGIEKSFMLYRYSTCSAVAERYNALIGCVRFLCIVKILRFLRYFPEWKIIY